MKNTQRGKMIAYYRRLNGLTQKELADKIGLSAKAISAWETGRNEPNMGQAYDVAAALGVDVTDLIQPQKEYNQKKEETVQLLSAWEKADNVTKEMVFRILGIDAAILSASSDNVSAAEAAYEKSLGIAPKQDPTVSNTTEGKSAVG